MNNMIFAGVGLGLALLVIVFFVIHFRRGLIRLKYQKEIGKNQLQMINWDIFEHVPVSIAVIDRDGNVLMANAYFKKLVQWDGVRGKNLLTSESILEAGLVQKYQNLFNKGISFTQKNVFINDPGPYYLDIEVVPWKNKNGEIIGAISIGQETTALFKARDDLEKINNNLNDEVKRRTEEFYLINDELYKKIEFYENIFSYLVDNLNILIKNETHAISETEKQILAVFKDLVILKQIEKKQIQLNLTRGKFSDYLQRIVDRLADSGKVNFVFLTGKGEVLVDPERFSDIIINLYNYFGEIAEKMTITLDTKGNQYLLNLAIKINDQEKIPAKINDFIYGVRLFMYKEIINLHKGILTESVEGNIITFQIKLLVS